MTDRVEIETGSIESERGGVTISHLHIYIYHIPVRLGCSHKYDVRVRSG